MADPACLTGGELNAAITKALVKIQSRQLGRGPTSASTFHHDNILVTLMHGVLTQAEHVLGHNGEHTSVMDWRATLQRVMEQDFRDIVEELTGRKVIAFISANHLAPDVAAEIFILDAPL